MKKPLEVISLYPPHDYTLHGAIASRMGRNPQHPFVRFDGEAGSDLTFPDVSRQTPPCATQEQG